MTTPIQDVRIARGNGRFEVVLGIDTTFSPSIRIVSDANDKGNFRSATTLKWIASNGNLVIREAWTAVDAGKVVNQSGVYSTLTFQPQDYQILGSDFERDENGEAGPNFIILLQVAEGRTLQTPVTGHADTKNQKHRGNLDLCDLHRNKGNVKLVKFVRIIITDVAKNRFFNAEIVESIMQGNGIPTSKKMAVDLVSRWHAALEAETEFKNAELRKLARDECIVTVEDNVRYPYRMALKVRSTRLNDDWKLEAGYRIQLLAPPDFAEEAPYPTEDGFVGWAAMVMPSSGRAFTAVIVNPTTVAEKRLIGQTIAGVKVTVVEVDPLADRFSLTIRTLGLIMAKERGELKHKDDKNYRLNGSRIPVQRILVNHPDHDVLGWEAMPLALQSGADSFVIEEEWRLEPSHLDFLEKVRVGKGGIAAAIGPPGTGKTTLLAKVTAILLHQAELSGPIVVTAHSNQAVVVLLERMIQQFKNILGHDPMDHVVWVETEGGQQRRADQARNTPVGLEAYSLQNRCFNLAMEDKTRWASYLKYYSKQQFGERTSTAEYKAYRKDLAELYELLRTNFDVFLCTLTTCATSFFTEGDKFGTFLCDVLIIDEASQPHWVECMEAQQVMCPRRIIYAGDDKQLDPFILSPAGRMAWERSPIQCIRERSPLLSVLLDTQFRMPASLYQPTSLVHYDGKVNAHPSNEEREVSAELRSKFRRIFIDSSGNGKWFRLGNNTVVFNVRFGEQESSQGTSQENRAEVRVVRHLVEALKVAGVSLTDVMLLTGYAGQFKLLGSIAQEHSNEPMAVRKIDSSQGDERPIVVLSTTVSNQVAFMGNPRRQNVGTSRQQEALFLVCREPLINHPDRARYWNKWFTAAESTHGGHNWKVDVYEDFVFRVDDKRIVLPDELDFSEPALQASIPVVRTALDNARRFVESQMVEAASEAHPVGETTSASGTSTPVTVGNTAGRPSTTAPAPAPVAVSNTADRSSSTISLPIRNSGITPTSASVSATSRQQSTTSLAPSRTPPGIMASRYAASQPQRFPVAGHAAPAVARPASTTAAKPPSTVAKPASATAAKSAWASFAAAPNAVAEKEVVTAATDTATKSGDVRAVPEDSTTKSVVPVANAAAVKSNVGPKEAEPVPKPDLASKPASLGKPAPITKTSEAELHAKHHADFVAMAKPWGEESFEAATQLKDNIKSAYDMDKKDYLEIIALAILCAKQELSDGKILEVVKFVKERL